MEDKTYIALEGKKNKLILIVCYKGQSNLHPVKPCLGDSHRKPSKTNILLCKVISRQYLFDYWQSSIMLSVSGKKKKIKILIKVQEKAYVRGK